MLAVTSLSGLGLPSSYYSCTSTVCTPRSTAGEAAFIDLQDLLNQLAVRLGFKERLTRDGRPGPKTLALFRKVILNAKFPGQAAFLGLSPNEILSVNSITKVSQLAHMSDTVSLVLDQALGALGGSVAMPLAPPPKKAAAAPSPTSALPDLRPPGAIPLTARPIFWAGILGAIGVAGSAVILLRR